MSLPKGLWFYGGGEPEDEVTQVSAPVVLVPQDDAWERARAAEKVFLEEARERAAREAY